VPPVPWRVSTVEALPDKRLRVVFVDGTTGEVDLDALLGKSEVAGTVFESLATNPGLFRGVYVDEFGAVTWPNGADLAPDAMYDAIRRNGRWVPS
jgi:hypothetical protein